MSKLTDAELLLDNQKYALNKVNKLHSGLLRAKTGNASPEEIQTWQTKAMAAEAYIAGSASNAQTAMLEAEAGGASNAPTLAAYIAEKSKTYMALIGAASRLRTTFRALVKAAMTPTEVESALTQAQAAFAQAMG